MNRFFKEMFLKIKDITRNSQYLEKKKISTKREILRLIEGMFPKVPIINNYF